MSWSTDYHILLLFWSVNDSSNFSSRNATTFSVSSFLNVRICCYSLFNIVKLILVNRFFFLITTKPGTNKPQQILTNKYFTTIRTDCRWFHFIHVSKKVQMETKPKYFKVESYHPSDKTGHLDIWQPIKTNDNLLPWQRLVGVREKSKCFSQFSDN